MEDESITYQTTNLYQAAWLLLHEVPLTKIDRANPKRAIFFFEDKDCDKLIKEFWEFEVMQKYISKIQDVKAMLYSEQSPVQFREVPEDDKEH